ncbi:response regulator [Echinicola sp. CAU 1574]|uniref:histidine kinase n=1 Tax=Echinicola arenosa TaxID=2774144 RepID=A0ABR9ATU4_9BACT|nr:response regulator [Echinicola arenosa]MBD8491298.1 response regulator [Echinicola arenosa]
MTKLSFKKLLIIGFSLSLIIVAFVNYSSYKSLKSFEERMSWVSHTYDVLIASKETLIQLINAEASQNGYILTGKSQYLEPYHIAQDSVHVSLHILKNLISDNPNQVKRVAVLEEIIHERLKNLETTLSDDHSTTIEAKTGKVLISKGQDLTSEVRKITAEIIAEENRLLNTRETQAKNNASRTIISIVAGLAAVLLILFLMFGYIMRIFTAQVKAEEKIKKSNDELEKLSFERSNQNWILKGEKLINESLQGNHSLHQLSEKILSFFASYLGMRIGALHTFDQENNLLKISASYAIPNNELNQETKLGEGLVGQAAKEKKTILINDLPKHHYKIKSSFGENTPDQLLLKPLIYNNQLKGILELGFLGEINKNQQKLVNQLEKNISIAIHTTQAHDDMRQLYEQLQVQSEELESQQEELRQTNEELGQQTEMLQASEEELRVQQEELRQTNLELEEKARLLEISNKQIEEARISILNKAEELERTSKYKSEFLANMSHELRTPLNSVLILAKLLSSNKNNTLDKEEVKYANVIHKAGSDLLTLINDILDLSKVESGQLDIYEEDIEILDIGENMQYLFKEVAADKKVNFKVTIDESLPKTIHSDRQRLDQIIRNLLSNAFKFTPAEGQVSLNFTAQSNNKLAISVQDSGIGISEEKQQLIFEAFKQADGSTSRKYGGTGLGLSISRELSRLLKGTISLISQEGQGSTFTLTIPYRLELENQDSIEATPTHISSYPKSIDNDNKLLIQDNHYIPEKITGKNLLIVEDDVNFAEILKNYSKEKGFETKVVYDGESAINYMSEVSPDAVLLDIMLPVMDGWEVLKRMKANARLKDIPVHIMSATDKNHKQLIESGAAEFIHKPVDQSVLERVFRQLQNIDQEGLKHVLIIEDQKIQSDILKGHLQKEGFEVEQAFNGLEAIEFSKAKTFDCIILDLNLPDLTGEEILDKIKSESMNKQTPVIINTAMTVPEELQNKIRQYSNAMVIKTPKSNDRILDEVKLFMHKINKPDAPTPSNGKTKTTSSASEKSFEGKKVLLVDDDMRNIFALSSSLQQYGLNVEIAGNGVEALNKLKEIGDFELVLMDIMMPEMDGYEAMKEIRKGGQYKEVPIIALTAKAMKNDREKCIEAGASDYIPKPVDLEKLLSMIRVWLSN